jgi:uridine kinase
LINHENPLDVVANRLAALSVEEHGCTVAIDGLDGAGKTSFAAALSQRMEQLGIDAKVASVDDFRPEGYYARSAADDFTPDDYFVEAYDYDALSQWVAHSRKNSTCVIVEGIWLLRPELAQMWDLTVLLDIDEDTSLARVLARDTQWIPAETLVARYRTRCYPAYALYQELSNPEVNADIIIDARPKDGMRLLKPE